MSVACAACGLYYLAELVEEYTVLTKRLMYLSTYAVLCAHPLFYLLEEQLPLSGIVSGMAAHGCYLWMLESFPVIRPASPAFLSAAALLVFNHYAWISHFLAHYHALTHVLCFLLFAVWLVPFGFFISLSANEATLPDRLSGGLGGGGEAGSGLFGALGLGGHGRVGKSV